MPRLNVNSPLGKLVEIDGKIVGVAYKEYHGPRHPLDGGILCRRIDNEYLFFIEWNGILNETDSVLEADIEVLMISWFDNNNRVLSQMKAFGKGHVSEHLYEYEWDSTPSNVIVHLREV